MPNRSPPRSDGDDFSIRRPMMLPLFGTLACLLVFFAFSSRWLADNIETYILEQETQNIARQLQEEIAEQALFFQHQMARMTHSLPLRSALLAGDRESLLREGLPILKSLQENHVTHLSFHRPDRVNLLRVHNPDLFNDPINRLTLLQAERSKSFAFGAEIGRTGTLALRGVLPWWNGPTLIGYLEIGKEIEHFVAELQLSFGHTLYTFLQRTALNPTQWRETSRHFGTTLDWNTFPDLVFVGPQESHYPESLRAYLASSQWRNDATQPTLSAPFGTKGERFFTIPVHDINNTVVCQIVGMAALSQYQTLMHRYILIVGGVASTLILLLGLVFNRLLARREHNIRTTAQALQQSDKRLTDNQELLNSILKSLEEGILVLDGNKKVRFANDRFIALWQLQGGTELLQESSQLLAQMQSRLINPAAFLAQIQRFRPGSHGNQGTLRCQDGRVLEYQAFPIPCAQEPCNQVWVFRDTTHRAAMEQREERAIQSRIAITALLETGMAPLSLEHQLNAALEIILAVPWLSLEYKGSIFLLEEDGEQLIMATQRGMPSELLAQCAQVPVGYCLCGRAAQRRALLFTPHINDEHEHVTPDMRPHGHYCVPILLRERLLGVLNLYVPDGHVRNPDEESFLTTLSYTLANLIERRAAEQNLLAERAFSASLLATAPALVVVMDPEGRAILFNQACQQLTGYPEREVIGRSVIQLLVPPSEREALKPVWEQLLQTRTPNQHENHWQAKNGELFLIAWSNNVIHHSDGSLRSVISTGIDITAQRRTEQMLQHIAGHDVLTGLPNRALFQVRLSEHLSMAARSDGKVALIFLDLDRFKQVNDSMGHKAGDELLKEATQRILSCVRPYDLVARLGGDEFTLILPQLAHISYVEFIARRILEALAKPFLLESGETHISGSIGITIYPQDATDMESLLKQADTAMYYAKTAGRNTFSFFTAEMQSMAMQRLRMEEGLRAALEKQAFVLHYQPKLDLVTQRINGMEALLRWHRSDAEGTTLVPPNIFIPLAEETGLIVPLGVWVLHAACRQNRAWQDQGLPPMRVAVNLSASQFHRPEALIESVTEALQESRLDPAWLELEITESMVMADEAKAIQTMKTLQEMGIAISVDDFGTGHSSLGSLKKFPIHTLKIDRTFIRDLADESSDESAIVQAILSLAKKLRLSVVAEGVETREQWEFLRREGCDEIQGYCFSRPLAAQAFAEFVQQHNNKVRS
ncbi:MAG: EAL domain-containing protein [Magnetococcales bacterium]|nr:EAL domain-containing protein [Magnetococcales bacterium]